VLSPSMRADHNTSIPWSAPLPRLRILKSRLSFGTAEALKQKAWLQHPLGETRPLAFSSP
jgi:hypothetical protein